MGPRISSGHVHVDVWSSLTDSRHTFTKLSFGVCDDVCVQGAVDWTVSEEATAPRVWAIIEALSPETVYEMRVVARSPAGRAESASAIRRVRIGLKRGTILQCYVSA